VALTFYPAARRRPRRIRAGAALALGLALSSLVAGCAGGVVSPASATASGPATAPVGHAPGTAAATASAFAPSSSSDPTLIPIARATPALSSSPGGTPQTEWTLDLYDKSGIRHQNPDYTACTAASVQTALNLFALSGGATQWQPTTSYQTQEDILRYERLNMTLPTEVLGSDPHGTRNALNYYGWGSLQANVYTDAGYATFDTAARMVVTSIARTHKPAVVFPWMGGHAQVVTGYKVHGADPAKSDDFDILGVYVTDPIEGTITVVYNGETHEIVSAGDDVWVSLAAWKYGPEAIQFSRYWQPDSILRDPLDGNVGRTEWYNRWVVVLATR
jgi:hypothetical protein